jgi:hypothetical protein
MYLLVLPESDTFDVGLEIELSNALHEGVVPEHDLVRRVLWALPASYQGNDVRPIEHLNDAYASVEFYSSMLIYAQDQKHTFV